MKDLDMSFYYCLYNFCLMIIGSWRSIKTECFLPFLENGNDFQALDINSLDNFLNAHPLLSSQINQFRDMEQTANGLQFFIIRKKLKDFPDRLEI